MRRYRWLWLAIAIITLVATAHLALAQFRGGGGGPGGFGGGPPFAMGDVGEIAQDGSSFTVNSQFGPNQVSVKVALTNDSQWMTVADAAVADIAVGDVLALNGQPLKLQAASVDIGGGLGQFFQMGMQPPPQPGQQPAAAPTGPQMMAFCNATGTVTKLDPLTVDVNGLAIEVELAQDSRVTKMTPMETPALNQGDKVFVFGQRQGDTLTAGTVVVDTTAEGIQFGFGFGGPGGRGGRGGRGGPGGPGGPGGGGGRAG